ncbi:MAG: DHH family phosphoesterase, partial [Candidatus Heimdallarchaeota archaeon]|nr:DHH family phosphoesterase [Candidatus Heimdallarchaeota archaeon]
IPHAINHINPYYYDIRGEDEISAAGVVYLFAKTFAPKNVDSSHLAIIGALGDMQNSGKQRTFHGVNAIILQEAIGIGKISTELNVAISRSSPIDVSLCNTLSEKIPGISGELNHVQEFLRRVQIPFMDDLGTPRTLENLSTMEIRALNSALIRFAIVECGWKSERAKKNYTTFYLLKEFDQNNKVSNGREMSRLLNSCGRMGHPSLGIALLLGDKQALAEALILLKDFKHSIRKAVQSAKPNIRELDHIYTVYESSVDERIIGTICSILLHSELSPTKPLFAFSDSDNHQLKISARADSSLVAKGLDLGQVLRQICTEMGISEPGGGHPPAAGAKIPANRLKTFIDRANELVKEQLAG